VKDERLVTLAFLADAFVIVFGKPRSIVIVPPKKDRQLVADGWISPAQDGRRPEPFFGTNINDSGSFLVILAPLG
jgi:hypothetical protein